MENFLERDSIDEEEYRKIDIPESSVWFPPIEIYHPKITKQEWIDLLHDETIFTENSLITFACLQNATEPSCTGMAKEFGRPKNFYNRNISSTGQRIYKKILCPLLDSKKQFWAICCFIKKLKNNHYVFKIRDELQQAFDETQILRDVTPMAKNDQEKILNELVEKFNQTTEIVNLLKNNKNLILYGAPGTGKTYLAKQIALRMIFPDCDFSVDDLDGNRMSAEQINFFNSHYKMVQFHPSYDYTDFVEGLRPVGNDENGNMRFERKDGVFKEFCKNALEKAKLEIEDQEISEEKIRDFLIDVIEKNKPIITANQKKYYIKQWNENEYEFSEFLETFNSNKHFSAEDCITPNANIVEKAIRESAKKWSNSNSTPFIFHIDEINRGEVSRIFGELFFCVEPAYRGEKGLIQTQYQNLVEDGDTFKNGFFIPKNVYIIGTMNDIDRSVDTLDFAFRRRFLFREITAAQSAQNMRIVGLALQRMSALNEAISDSKIGGLNSSFHIGASYFSDFNSDNADFLELWNCKLEGLLREYLRGEDDVEEKIEMLHTAFDLKNSMEKN